MRLVESWRRKALALDKTGACDRYRHVLSPANHPSNNANAPNDVAEHDSWPTQWQSPAHK